jgi:hypothetical protein
VTAAIFESLYGHELRVFYDGDQNNIVSTKVSRTDDGPLEQEAEAIRITLEEVGWRAG